MDLRFWSFERRVPDESMALPLMDIHDRGLGRGLELPLAEHTKMSMYHMLGGLSFFSINECYCLSHILCIARICGGHYAQETDTHRPKRLSCNHATHPWHLPGALPHPMFAGASHKWYPNVNEQVQMK